MGGQKHKASYFLVSYFSLNICVHSIEKNRGIMKSYILFFFIFAFSLVLDFLHGCK
jgi:hypothetical protein